MSHKKKKTRSLNVNRTPADQRWLAALLTDALRATKFDGRSMEPGTSVERNQFPWRRWSSSLSQDEKRDT
jgi:hypothetical protein